MVSSFWFDTINLDGPLYTLIGHRLKFLNQIVVFFSKDKVCLLYGADPDEMLHLIWVFTVCQSTRLGAFDLQRFKERFAHL